jgi:hypothetical protein
LSSVEAIAEELRSHLDLDVAAICEFTTEGTDLLLSPSIADGDTKGIERWSAPGRGKGQGLFFLLVVILAAESKCGKNQLQLRRPHLERHSRVSVLRSASAPEWLFIDNKKFLVADERLIAEVCCEITNKNSFTQEFLSSVPAYFF